MDNSLDTIIELSKKAKKHEKDPIAAAILVLAHQLSEAAAAFETFNKHVEHFDHQICMGIREGRKEE